MTAQEVIQRAKDGTLTPGMYDVPTKEYHAIPFYSSSYLKRFRENPAGAQIPFTGTKFTLRGQAGHAWILEGEDVFHSEFAVIPDSPLNKNTREYKELKASFYAANAGKEVITAEDFEIIRQCKISLEAHPITRRFLRAAQESREVTVFWRDPGTNAWCKARLDMMPDQKTRSIFDLKMVSEATPRGFFYTTIKKMQGFLQAGHYVNGMAAIGVEINRFNFIGVLTDEPYTPVTGYLKATEYLLQFGQVEAERMISLDESIRKSGIPYPNYPLPAHAQTIEDITDADLICDFDEAI